MHVDHVVDSFHLGGNTSEELAAHDWLSIRSKAKKKKKMVYPASEGQMMAKKDGFKG